MKIIRLILINVLIAIAGLLVINWGSGVLLRTVFKTKKEKLPTYSNEQKAKEILKDWRKSHSYYAPFIGWKKDPYTSENMNIDYKGRRFDPQRQPAPNDSLTIGFFGGSTMIGQGVDDKHTIPSLVDSLMSGIQVYNYGQIGFNARQELAFLINEYATGEHFDHVVFYDGVNEVLSLCRKEIATLPNHMRVAQYEEKINSSVNSLFFKDLSKGFYKNILRLVIRLQDKDMEELGYNCSLSSDKAKEIASNLISTWKMAKTIAESNNSKFIAILQPMAFKGAPNLEYLDLNEGFREIYTSVYNEIIKQIEQENLNYAYDFTEKLNVEEPVYFDPCHISDKGNEIIGAEIVKILKQ